MSKDPKKYFGQSLSTFFDRIYCINLDSRPDRWAYVTGEFSEFGLDKEVNRFPGIDLRTDPRYFEKERLHRGNFSLLGNCGCTLSHRGVIAAADQADLECVLVFEDDVKFLDSQLDGIRQSLAELDALDWEVFYLGASYTRPILKLSDHLVHVSQGANATHAIAYHRRFFSKFLDAVPADPLELLSSQEHRVNAIDIWLNSEWFDHSKFYGTNPIMVLQGLQNSDIARKQYNVIADKQLELFRENLVDNTN